MLLVLPVLLLALAFAFAFAWPRRPAPRGRRRIVRAASLTPEVPRPVHRRAKPAWVTLEIIHLKAHLPGAGCRQLADTFNRLHAAHQVSVGKTWVSQVLTRHHYAILQQRRDLRRRPPYPIPCNRTWAMDLTGKGDEAGTAHAIPGLIDHGSRRALCLTALPRKTSLTLLGHLLIAIGAFGKPVSLRTDNEAVFTSRVFRAGLALLDIRHQRIDLGYPWQNGRIERLFGTVKSVLDRLTVANADTLQHTLALIANWYNEIRPHQNLGGRTPAEAWRDMHPYSLAFEEAHYVEALVDAH